MFLTIVVIVAVSVALVAGAVWGAYGTLSSGFEGFMVALAGGALIVSVVLELLEPAIDVAPLWAAAACVLGGAVAFVGLNRVAKARLGTDSGASLLATNTVNGIPENLALGVALIGTGPLQVAALSGSILLSNLPEAASGAQDMAKERPRRTVLGLWTATAVLLSVAALAGNLLLADLPAIALGLVRCFAAGAVTASLAIEVLPKAFKKVKETTGIAVALGVVLAVGLNQLG